MFDAKQFAELRARLVDLQRRGWPASEPVGFDVETFGPQFEHGGKTKPDFTRARLAGYSIAFVDGARYYVPLRHPDTDTGAAPAPRWDEDLSRYQPLPERWRLLRFLEQPGCTVYIHNAKTEIAVLANEGYRILARIRDSELLSWMAGWKIVGKGGLKLKALAKRHLGHDGPTFDEVSQGRASNAIPATELGPYAANDAWLALALGLKAEARVAELESEAHAELEMRCIPVTEHMERVGVGLDRAYLLAAAERCEDEAAKVAARFEALTTTEVTVPVKVRRPKPCPTCNGEGWVTEPGRHEYVADYKLPCPGSGGRKACLGGILHHKHGGVVEHTVLEDGRERRGARVGSDADVSRWLFKELGWWPVAADHPVVEYGPSVKEEFIRRFAALPGDAGEACRLRLRYQALRKYASTYTRSLVSLADQAGDGRLHTSYKQDGTDTVRYSSSMPNQSNLPKSKRQDLPWMKDLPDIRKAFLPREGWDIVILDFSQIELRLAAHYSRDRNLMAAYIPDKDGKTLDLHECTRLSMQAVAAGGMVVSRSDAKITNFSTLYKISKFSLARKLAMGTNDWDTYTPAVAQGFIDGFEAAYEGVPRYQQRAIDYAMEHNYSTCLTGFKRPITEWNDWGYDKDTGRRYRLRGSCERKAINTPIQASAGGILKRSLVGLYERWTTGSTPMLGQHVNIVGQTYDEIIVECHPSVRGAVMADMKHIMEGAAPELRVPLVAEGGYGPSWSDAK